MTIQSIIICLFYQEENKGGGFYSSIIRGYGLLLPLMSTVSYQSFRLHTLVILLQEIQTFLVSTFIPNIPKTNLLLSRNKLIQSQVLV